MKFIVDAQLPPRLATFLTTKGHDAVHVETHPHDVRTSDAEISAFADAESRVVVTKDSDFRHSHTVSGSPARLLLVATGNIRNDDLIALFDSRIEAIATAFGEASFIELHRQVLIIHGTD